MITYGYYYLDRENICMDYCSQEPLVHNVFVHDRYKNISYMTWRINFKLTDMIMFKCESGSQDLCKHTVYITNPTLHVDIYVNVCSWDLSWKLNLR